MQLALMKTRGVAEQAGHGMADAAGILETFSEHHIAAALAMNRTCPGKAGKTTAKSVCGGKGTRMQFRITARQPADIAGVGRRLVGERREGHDLGAGAPPTTQ